MKPIRWMIFVLALVLLAAPGFSAAAQQGGPTLTARAAFDGNYKYGEWLPILAEIENPGPDVEAELNVRIGSSSTSTIYSTPVSLPSGAHKLVPLYILANNYSRQLDVRLVKGDTLLANAKVNVHPQPNVTYFAGFLAPQRGALALFNGAKFSAGPDRPKVMVDLILEDLPERSEGLNSFDLLVLNDTDTAKLTPQQVDALRNWVSSGGRLVIGGGAAAAQTIAGLPEDLLPVKLTGTSEVDADALEGLAKYAGTEPLRVPGPFALATVDAGGGNVLAGTPVQPLLVEKAFGHGSVDFVALDLAAAPFDGWPGASVFWQKLATNGSAFPENFPTDVSMRQMRAGSLYGALTNIPSLDLPSVRSLVMLLTVYVLLVGPANFFLLRRMKRLHMAWVTIPVITLLFAGGAFGIGFAMRGNDLILNKIGLAELQPEGPARLTTYMGLFSPARQAYEIEVNSSSLLSPAQPDYGPEMPGSIISQEMTFVQGKPGVVRGVSVNQWSMQGFTSEDTWPELGKLTASLALENDTLKGSVRNDTGVALKDVVLTFNRRFQKLGDMAPGQEVKVDLGLAELNKDWNGPSLSYKLYIEQQQNQNQGRIPRDMMLKVNVIDSVIDSAYWSKIGGQPETDANASGSNLRNLVVFGWAEQNPLDVKVRGYPITQMTTTLVYADIPIGLSQTGRVTLPPGLMRGKFVELPRGYGTCGPVSTTSIFMDGVEVVAEFQVPDQLLSYNITALKLSISIDNPSAGIRTLGLYDWQQEKWGGIDRTSAGTVIIPNAAPYVSQDGRVRVRLANNQGNPGCYFIDVGLDAEPAAGNGG